VELFPEIISDIRAFIETAKARNVQETCVAEEGVPWPEGGRNNIVLSSETGVELGKPDNESASFLVWTGLPGIIDDGMLHCVGPDIPDMQTRTVPFGKAVLLEVRGMTEENCYDRHRQLERVRYDISLKGYMMRAVSQYMREWSRVSREAVEKGFSLQILGSALMSHYRAIDFVTGVEIIFITSSTADVRDAGSIGEKAMRLIGAMNRMTEEMSFDCDSCEYVDVCSEVEGLRDIHAVLKRREAL
jgi:CO dehydrogenase/acetyl-CoA synthase beta subunit